MRRPWKQRNEFSELESDLRAARPEPRSDLISQLVGRVEATRVPFRRSRVRLALAGVLTTAALMAYNYRKANRAKNRPEFIAHIKPINQAIKAEKARRALDAEGLPIGDARYIN